MFAPYFVEFLRREIPNGVDTLFEWCSGPAFIGFNLLQAGICRQLVLADINPRAIECVRETVRINRLEERVRTYVSENLRSVPAHERFDAVVANPPFYCSLNPEHPLYDEFKDDMRPNDPGWRAHDDFYDTIAEHLNPAAALYIMEVEPEQTVYFTPGFPQPWDVRPRPPIDDFRRMIAAGGLTYERTADFIDQDGYRGQLVISRFTGGGR